jgi:hypothetical protein
MARFKRKSSRARASSMFRRRGARRSSGGSNPLMTVILPAFAYGAVRETAKSYAAPLTGMLPFGTNNDEAVFGLAGYFLMKKTSGFMHDFGRAALTVEAASLGNNIVSPMLPSGATGTMIGNSPIYGV